MGSKRICEICSAEISKEWDNDQHYGTCPSCKRGANFIIENKELQHIADEENEINKKNHLLQMYNVVQINDRSGITHVNCIGLAKLINNECGFHFKTIEDEDTGKQEIYFYNDGYYHAGGENRIREIADTFLDEHSSIHRKNEVVDYIKHRSSMKRERVEPPVNLINLKNGIYNLETDKLEKHNPDFFFLNQIPVEYHKNRECPQIKKFLKEVLYKEYVPVVQELVGYLLYRRYKYHKAFLFYGGGRNGKSTLINMLQRFLGKHNYSNRSLISLLENRFATASLYGKLANFGSEISGKAIIDTSQFKHLTGDDSVSAEKKFYGSFTFRNYAKLIFNANHIPYSKYDKSLAYFQRWIILVFPETFEANDKKTDPNIEDKITTKKELEGLLFWGIEGLKRLLKDNKFSYIDDDDEESVGERYELLAKPEMRFLKDYIMLSENSTLETEEVYKKYYDWSEKRNYPIQVKKVFTRAVKKYMVDKEKKLSCEVINTSRGGRSARVYKNICWKDEPTNSLRLDGFIKKEDDKELPDDLKKGLNKIRENIEAGYPITDAFLESMFKPSFITNLLESGMLVRKGDGSYILG